MESYSVESCMRGYHVYKDVWEASVGEDLSCQRVSGNNVDPFAVAVVKNGMTVGHVPRRISSVSSLFLRKGGVIKVCITETRRYSTDLPQGACCARDTIRPCLRRHAFGAVPRDSITYVHKFSWGKYSRVRDFEVSRIFIIEDCAALHAYARACAMLPYGGLFSWGANFRGFRS